MNDHAFVSFLLDKLVSHVDTDLIDLSDDDTAGIDAILFQQLELEIWLIDSNWKLTNQQQLKHGQSDNQDQLRRSFYAPQNRKRW